MITLGQRECQMWKLSQEIYPGSLRDNGQTLIVGQPRTLMVNFHFPENFYNKLKLSGARHER